MNWTSFERSSSLFLSQRWPLNTDLTVLSFAKVDKYVVIAWRWVVISHVKYQILFRREILVFHSTLYNKYIFQFTKSYFILDIVKICWVNILYLLAIWFLLYHHNRAEILLKLTSNTNQSIFYIKIHWQIFIEAFWPEFYVSFKLYNSNKFVFSWRNSNMRQRSSFVILGPDFRASSFFFKSKSPAHFFTFSGKREMGITKPWNLTPPVLYIYNVKYECGTGRLYCPIYVTFILVIV
jgi:hypothetical protein